MSNFELHFELEPNCILACRHCSSQAIKKESIQYTEKDVLRLVKAADPCEIYFTGGEPLLFENLAPLFSGITSQLPACKLGLFTTGIIQRDGHLAPVGVEYLTQLYQAGLRVCYISLYSDEEQWHDYMTNTTGSFMKTVQAIKNMTAVGIDTRINLVVARFNASRIRDIIHFVSGLNVSEVRLLKLIRHGNASNCWDTIGLSDQEYLQAITSIYSTREELETRITFSSIPKLDPCRPLSNSRGCQARKNLLYVTLTGDIYPCACVKNDTAYLICNIKDVCLEQLVNINVDKKPCYTTCLAERNHLEKQFDDFVSSLFSNCFSEFSCINKSDALAAAIRDFLHDAKSYASRTDFFELLFKKNKSSCLYYEVHSFFVKHVENGKVVCLIAPHIDASQISQVHSICENKFPDVQIEYQQIDSTFIDQYMKEELLKRFASAFGPLVSNSENDIFVKNCMGL